MQIKKAALTFVAMGGFAVPIEFQMPASSGSVSAPAGQPAAVVAPTDDRDADKK